MNVKHIVFPNVYAALEEVSKIIRNGGYAYVLKSDNNGAVVSVY